MSLKPFYQRPQFKLVKRRGCGKARNEIKQDAHPGKTNPNIILIIKCTLLSFSYDRIFRGIKFECFHRICFYTTVMLKDLDHYFHSRQFEQSFCRLLHCEKSGGQFGCKKHLRENSMQFSARIRHEVCNLKSPRTVTVNNYVSLSFFCRSHWFASPMSVYHVFFLLLIYMQFLK